MLGDGPEFNAFWAKARQLTNHAGRRLPGPASVRPETALVQVRRSSGASGSTVLNSARVRRQGYVGPLSNMRPVYT